MISFTNSLNVPNSNISPGGFVEKEMSKEQVDDILGKININLKRGPLEKFQAYSVLDLQKIILGSVGVVIEGSLKTKKEFNIELDQIARAFPKQVVGFTWDDFKAAVIMQK
jgi:hypothetical protein